jgi:outer membrane biosynthesis protein TonB
MVPPESLLGGSLMAAKKKAASKTKPKRPAPKPKRKASPAPKRAQPKAKPAAVAKKAKARVATVAPKPKAKPAPTPQRAAAAPPPPSPSAVRPGLQKRPEAMPIGVVSVTDGDRLIEQSTFYSTVGRDEYVQRWEARGYTCRFTPWNN